MQYKKPQLFKIKMTIFLNFRKIKKNKKIKKNDLLAIL